LGDSLEKKGGYTRPITTRQNVTTYTSKREEVNTSYEAPKPNTIQNISQYARNGNNNAKMNKSTYEPTSSISQKVQHYGESSFR
jgi:hypothetical protein